MKHKRQIKLSEHHSPRSWNRYKLVPKLRISGIWLEEAGFKMGDYVEIEISSNQLIIKPKENED